MRIFVPSFWGIGSCMYDARYDEDTLGTLCVAVNVSKLVDQMLFVLLLLFFIESKMMSDKLCVFHNVSY